MPDAVLSVDNVTAGYVPDLPILRDVSLMAEREKLTVIIGPNGAGKSTLIKAVIGLLPVSNGSVTANGQDITGLSPDRITSVGIAYVPQTDNVFRTLTIRQNLDLALQKHSHASQRLSELYERFPVLADKQRDKAGSLSGGQRQFLAVAMALAADPSLILMDEPSAGLSPKAAEEVLDHAKQLTGQGVSILLVEQNVKQALKRADHCYVLAEGRNQIDGPASDLLQDPALGRIYLGGERRVPA
ncbi:ABC transporter ATP-binding protein [Roseibium sp.]|uniref:ABC transporter ATP-binding protein n=1 Tax=Roseibium sp. TaxID=1936156 RepID=UPI003B519D26